MKKFFTKLFSVIFKPTPRGKVRWAVFFILVLAILAVALDAPMYWDKGADWVEDSLKIDVPHFYNLPFRLGLDLLGGTHLVYEADMANIPSAERSDAVAGARDVIERRVNAFGVSEPVIQTTKTGDSWRVVVELAGIKDVHKAIEMIGETPMLEFKEQNKDVRELTAEEKSQLEKNNKEVKIKAEEVLIQALGADEAGFDKLIEEKTEGTVLPMMVSERLFSPIFEAAKKAELNAVYNKLVEMTSGYYIIKPIDRIEEEKEVEASHILICYKGASNCPTELTKDEALAKINEVKSQVTPENFAVLAKTYSNDTGTSSEGGGLGFFGKGKMVPPFEEKVFAMATGEISEPVETDFGYHLIYKSDERSLVEYQVKNIFLKKQTEQDILGPQDPWKVTGLTGVQLKKSMVQFDQNTGAAEVGLEFNDEGKKLFGEITERNVGEPVAIFLDGEALSIPRVNEPIRDGKAVITGDFNIDEAKTLSRRLNAGALPVPIKLVSQQTVGATLGNQSVNDSLTAGLIGILLVMIFMIIYYRLPGFWSSLALIVYGAIVLALFKIIPVTLTLSGIAGFILSIGMAIDANVLIFERLKEELKSGKSLGSAIDDGFKRAWPSIRDSNVTTLISCVILATFTTSIVKGFAITLGVGVIVSMFSAITVSRIFLKLGSNRFSKNWWYGVKNKIE
ncbi:MAG: protein translocase subunit SecD [Patescibacteria group bacterium]|nr:protein translocase subunit SecD [Patescibacteria group bacterium]MDD5490516.1 protein translocase subunit SecD [Patescibacteria group bacterium]